VTVGRLGTASPRRRRYDLGVPQTCPSGAEPWTIRRPTRRVRRAAGAGRDGPTPAVPARPVAVRVRHPWSATRAGASGGGPDRRRPCRTSAGPEPAPGLREQIGATRDSAKRLVDAHVELARAEFEEIGDAAKRASIYVGIAIGTAIFAVLLLGVGLPLFLGEWIFGSIGWGILLGLLILGAAARVRTLLALEPAIDAHVGAVVRVRRLHRDRRRPDPRREPDEPRLVGPRGQRRRQPRRDSARWSLRALARHHRGDHRTGRRARPAVSASGPWPSCSSAPSPASASASSPRRRRPAGRSRDRDRRGSRGVDRLHGPSSSRQVEWETGPLVERYTPSRTIQATKETIAWARERIPLSKRS
jgi:hypothetical protein